MAQVKYTASDHIPDKIILRAWPKMLFLWPSALLALAAGIGTYLTAETMSRWEFWGTLFLTIFAVNLMVITFEFPRSTSLTLVLACVALAWLLVELNRRYHIIAPVSDFIESLELTARPDFYFALFVIYALLLIGMFISTRFNYWEISNNELLHHKGLLQDVERFSTDGLQYTKQITDFFEYLIGRSGRLIVNTPAFPQPIIIDNVIGINRIAENLDNMLEARRVVVSGGLPQPVAVPVEPQA
ncbi:MAG: hypothetical protein KF832_22395 [Caldilineaceae bacterium]|nr:hypothetical protein [Caldilineaceae bacterium]